MVSLSLTASLATLTQSNPRSAVSGVARVTLNHTPPRRPRQLDLESLPE